MCMPRMITINQAVEATGLSYDAIRKMCIRNEIVNMRVGKKFMINAEKLEQYLNGEEVEACGESESAPSLVALD